jgi:fused signal recognition particle receptor
VVFHELQLTRLAPFAAPGYGYEVGKTFRRRRMTDSIAAENEEKTGWFQRLRQGLARSSARLTDGIAGIFTRRRLDGDTLQELEDLLVMGDLGPETAARLVADLSRERFGKEVSPEEVREALAKSAADILAPVAKPLPVSLRHKPFVILFVGVNGSGKTTSIGKLARQFRAAGKSVMLVAGDTFRAAAVGQLKIWGERAGCEVVSGPEGADAAGLAFDALAKARAQGAEIVMIDTAGRLQNKANLMEELAKIARVIRKFDESAPHATLLVLDATTGQNAYSQVDVFRQMAPVSGLVLTKLDGSAKGGVLIGLAERFGIPVHAIGIGEGVKDLRPFKPEDFARSLLGLE